MGSEHPALEIDARGLRCPLPVLKLEKALEPMASGAVITILADDPVARIDIPLFCRKAGHACTTAEADGALHFEITKSG